MANRVRQKTITRMLSEQANAFFKAKYPNDVTRKAFCTNYKKFIRFCRQRYRCCTAEECRKHINDYVQFLTCETAYTPSTIHSYLAPVCVYFGVSMKEFIKPRRHTAAYIRGRSVNRRKQRSDNDFSNCCYTPIYLSAAGFSGGCSNNRCLHRKLNHYADGAGKGIAEK